MARGTKPAPKAGMEMKAVPMVGKPENTVMIGGVPVEIKPTKLKYLRNGTAGFYRLLDTLPLNDIVMMPAGTFGQDDTRDGDKALMDWLIAATDNEETITANYNEMDAGQIETVLEIFKRINKFCEREENLKNAQAPRATAE